MIGKHVKLALTVLSQVINKKAICRFYQFCIANMVLETSQAI